MESSSSIAQPLIILVLATLLSLGSCEILSALDKCVLHYVFEYNPHDVLMALPPWTPASIAQSPTSQSPKYAPRDQDMLVADQTSEAPFEPFPSHNLPSVPTVSIIDTVCHDLMRYINMTSRFLGSAPPKVAILKALNELVTLHSIKPNSAYEQHVKSTKGLIV